MRVRLTPIVPDNVQDLRKKVLDVSEKFGWRKRVPEVIYSERILMHIDENDDGWNFLNEVKEICEVDLG